jgi:hypothetical protein
MEEILASIRRIIADDDSAKPAAVPPAPASPVTQRPAALPPRTPVPPSPPPRPAAPEPAAAEEQHDAETALAAIDAQHDDAAPATEDVLDLTEQMAAPAESEPPSFQTIDGQTDVFFAEAPAEPPSRSIEELRAAAEPHYFEEPQRQPSPAASAPEPEPNLMSSAASAAVDSAFNALAQTVLVQNARTLEDLVREMLRPLLKSWLDDNLPGMVERIVRAEIERVSRGR